MFLADLHVHSTFSDGKMNIPELVDFYGTRGFGAIAITDHIVEHQAFLGRAAGYLNLALSPATFPIYKAIIQSEADRAWRKYRMVVIAGFELSKNSWFNHRSAHILGIGIKEFMTADGDIKDLARGIRAQGGLAIAAHPVSTGKFEPQTFHLWSRREELRHEFDAWEVASGVKYFSEVQESGLPLLATSDLHRPNQINSWKTVFTCERSQDAILESVRAQDLSFTFYQEPAVESSNRRARWVRRPRAHNLEFGPLYGHLGHVAHASSSPA
jgi:hypothetical protein